MAGSGSGSGSVENPKVGGCYICFISIVLFVFTVSGAVFLVLYMTEDSESTPSSATYWYPVIGISLVCFPWLFWLVTFVYRVVSRTFGFRFVCFNPFGGGSGNPDEEIGPPTTTIAGAGNGGGEVAISGGNGGGAGDGEEGKIGNETGNGNWNWNENENGEPRRVHFGGVVIIGEENNNVLESPRPSSSSSSSSSPSMQSNESEVPLRLAMA